MTEHQELTRAAFEKWARGKVSSLLRGRFGRYVYADAARAWEAWQECQRTEQLRHRQETAILRAVSDEYDALIRHMDGGGEFHAFQASRLAKEQHEL